MNKKIGVADSAGFIGPFLVDKLATGFNAGMPELIE